MVTATTPNVEPVETIRGEGGRFAPGHPYRFKPGNSGGPGNPHGKKAAEFRAALMETVTREDIVEVTKALVRAARKGEDWAIRELYDRVIGKAEAADLLEKVATIEELIAAATAGQP